MSKELEAIYNKVNAQQDPLEEIYAQVNASGSSEGAKKGWEQRGKGLKSHIEGVIGQGHKITLSETEDEGTFWFKHSFGSYTSTQAKELHEKIRKDLESTGYKKSGSSHGRQNVGQAGRGVNVYSNGKQEVHLGGSGFSNNDWNAYVHVKNK